MRAYILLKVQPQNTVELMDGLRRNEHITEASLIHGPYDCLAVVQAKDLDGITEAVMTIRAMKGVMDTMTCLIFQSWQRQAA